MKKIWGIVIALLVTLVFIWGTILIGNQFNIGRLQTGENPLLRFAFVIVGLLIVLILFLFTRENQAWVVGTREVVWMAIGAALYAVFSWLFNGTVFVVPSVSQVALRPAIAIPMFFGYAFGPVVGFFSGAVGNMFGDALTGFGLSPQWSIGNGLVGLIAGLPMLFGDKKKSLNAVLIAGIVLVAIVAVLYFLNPTLQNLTYYNPENDTFGETPLSLLAGISILIGLVLVLIVRFVFGKDIDIATAVTWSMLGNILGIGFAAVSDIWINGYPPVLAIVGEFLPAAGPNLIFAAILVPLLVVAYKAVQRQSGR
ncbi:MAG: ECF transporter S component [Anaerolineales bacterium]